MNSNGDSTVVRQIRAAMSPQGNPEGPDRRSPPVISGTTKWIIGTFLPLLGILILIYSQVQVAEKDLRDLETRHKEDVSDLKDAARVQWERVAEIREHSH